jgi:glycosyltransferase involved in cell wall biosynthesis
MTRNTRGLLFPHAEMRDDSAMVSQSDGRLPHTVVHLLETASERGMAHARMVVVLARAIDPTRYRLRAWFLDGPGPLVEVLTAAGVPARTAIFRGGRDIGGALRFAGALKADRPTLVHLHVGGRSRLWLLRALTSAKRVAHVHRDRAEDGTRLSLESLTTSAHAVIATSMAVARAVPGPATVVYPGTDIPDRIAPLSASPPTIGTVARLEFVKGLPFLLNAAGALQRRHPNLRIEVAGSGSCEPRLRLLASRLGLARSVSFLGWRQDVDALHRRWQVFAQPSIYEGFGLAALEAMSSGLPVVASATGGLPELVEDGVTGFLVPIGDVDTLADRLGRLLEDEELRVRMGQAARERVREHFSGAVMGAKTAQVYDRLLAK